MDPGGAFEMVEDFDARGFLESKDDVGAAETRASRSFIALPARCCFNLRRRSSRSGRDEVLLVCGGVLDDF